MSVFVLPDPDTVALGGLRFAALTEGEVVHRVRAALARGIGGRIATPNVDILRQAELRRVRPGRPGDRGPAGRRRRPAGVGRAPRRHARCPNG